MDTKRGIWEDEEAFLGPFKGLAKAGGTGSVLSLTPKRIHGDIPGTASIKILRLIRFAAKTHISKSDALWVKFERVRVLYNCTTFSQTRANLTVDQGMRRVADWACYRQTEYNKAAIVMQQEINRAKQEASDQAHTINQDLASELESLQYEATEMLL